MSLCEWDFFSDGLQTTCGCSWGLGEERVHKNKECGISVGLF